MEGWRKWMGQTRPIYVPVFIVICNNVKLLFGWMDRWMDG